MAYLWELDIKDGTKISSPSHPKPRYRQWFKGEGVWKSESGNLYTLDPDCGSYEIYEEPEKVTRKYKCLLYSAPDDCWYESETYSKLGTAKWVLKDRWIEVNGEGELVNWSGKDE